MESFIVTADGDFARKTTASETKSVRKSSAFSPATEIWP